jgi:hypothetical protein
LPVFLALGEKANLLLKKKARRESAPDGRAVAFFSKTTRVPAQTSIFMRGKDPALNRSEKN